MCKVYAIHKRVKSNFNSVIVKAYVDLLLFYSLRNIK